VEKEIEYKNIKLKEHEKLAEELIEKMDKEITKSEHTLMNLLEESTTNAENDEHHLISLILILIVVMVVIIVAGGYFAANTMKNGINYIADKINMITKNQDLTIRLESNGKDEFSEIGQNINTLLNNLKDLIDDSKNSSAENATISHELSTTSLNVGRNVENSVSIVNDATKQALSIQENINDTIVIAQQSKDEIKNANQNLFEAQNDVLELTNQVQNSAMLENELADKMSTLSSNANDVKAILEVISDIADQTNLLALNAAIEAARAGEHGRGFAVVADEVRKLAERTQSSLTEINSTINVIVQSILEASEQMGDNSKVVKSLSDKALSVKNKIDITTQIVDNTTHTIDKMVQEFDLTTKNIQKNHK
jgi:methyl-accepting chemotaxis protein